jgi:hypothetical protein
LIVLSGSNQKNSVGFDQFSSFGKNKVDTIYWGPAFSLQTCDILRVSHKNRVCQNLYFHTSIWTINYLTDIVIFIKTLEFLFQSNLVLLKYLPTKVATRIVK